MTTTTPTDWRVDVPEGTSGNVEVRKITVADDYRNRMAGARYCTPGEYTALYRNGYLWMSDTSAEQLDHFEPVWQARTRGGSCLVMGLGLGMVVRQMLESPNVEHIDVVELDRDVINLVGPTYAGPRCAIHHADAYSIRWPVGTRWAVAWHDIWADLCLDNLPQMATLARSYGRRVDWQGFWGKDLLVRERARERRDPWNN